MFNNKVRIAILGCCASRELFNYTEKFEVKATVYSSIISLFENKIDVSMDDCVEAADSYFQARNTYLDFNKLTFEYLSQLSSKSDYLVIDFAETVSDYFFVNVCSNNNNYNAKITANPFVKNVLVKRGYKYDKLSSMNVDIKLIVKLLFQDIFLIYPKDRVLLNQVSYSNAYIDQKEIKFFSDHYRLKQENIKKVRSFEAEAKKYVEPNNVLEPIEICLSNKEHKYGCSPLHYTDDDYYFMAQRIENQFGYISDNKLYEVYCNLYKNSRGFFYKLI